MNAIEWLLEVPKQYGDREFLIDTITGENLTFASMFQTSLAVATDLQQRGFKRGDRVAMILHNSASLAKLYFGCLYAGLVVVPINPVFTRHDIDFMIKHGGVKLLVISPETMDRVDLSLIRDAGIKTLVLDDRRPSQRPESDLPIWDLQKLSQNSTITPFESMTQSDTMAIVYTSGTTSRPSGVVRRIETLVNNARAFNHRLDINENNRFYGTLAMTYLGGYYNLLMLPYVSGASVVLSNTFDAKAALNFWHPAQKEGVNTLWLVPTIMSILLEMDRGEDGPQFCRDNIDLALVGTAPLPLQLKSDFESRYGISLQENYGLSETLFISTNAPTLPFASGSLGRSLPDVQVTVLDTHGKALPYGTEGELYVCTPYLMEGYYSPNTQQADLISPEDWFPTGDIGIISPTGDLYITGRKKDLIIRGGINISPNAIEDILHTHPAVVECAVVGIPHPLYGEDIAAAVRLKPGSDFETLHDDLMRMSKEQLSPLSQPAAIIEIETFPHSSSGKIQKNKIRDLLAHKLDVAHLSMHNAPQLDNVPASKPLTLPGKVRHAIQRPSPETIKALQQYPTSIISDCMNRLGILDSAVHSIVRGKKMCGPAITVEEFEGGNLMSHIALDMLQTGDVLVIDAKGVTTRACWGGLQTLMAHKRGAAGIVIHGSMRDYEDAVHIGIPIFALGTSPGGPHKGTTGNINYPISCAGVTVSPGDIMLGDDDGVVVIPHHLIGDLLPLCEQRSLLEQEWFNQVEQGKSTLQAVGLEEKLRNFDIQYD